MPKTKIVSVNIEPVVASVLAALPHSVDSKRILKGLGAAGMHQWKKLAQEQLRSTARDYVEGLNHREVGNKVEITLDGKMANMVEQGIEPYDMRTTLLSGPKVKRGKDGQPYATIPFGHGTPGTTERNVGPRMPKAIHNAAQRLQATVTRPSGVSELDKLKSKRLHPGLDIGAKARSILNSTEKPWHKTSIYTSMIRKGKDTVRGKVETTGYQTFRRISRNSDPRAWQHPGIKAREIAKQVQDYLGTMAESIVKTATSK